MKEVRVKFEHENVVYNVSFIPREMYYIHNIKDGDNEFSIRVSFTNNYISVYKMDDHPFSPLNQVYVGKIKSNKVKASKFIQWYFSDKETNDYMYRMFVGSIKDNGSFNVSVVDIFNQCGYVPSAICETIDADNVEYDPSDLLFEDDITPTTLDDNQKMQYYL